MRSIAAATRAPEGPVKRRRVTYTWHLRQVMAAHGLWQTTELGPSSPNAASSCRRPRSTGSAAGVPERLSLRTLAALCDIFECTPNDLIETEATAGRTPVKATAKRTGGQTAPPGPDHRREPAMTGSACANGCGRTTRRPAWPGGALCRHVRPLPSLSATAGARAAGSTDHCLAANR